MERKKLVLSLLMISLILLVFGATSIAIDVIFINIKMPSLITVLAVVSIVLGFPLLFGTISYCFNKDIIRKSKLFKPIYIAFISCNIVTTVLFAIVILFFFVVLVSSLAGAFWSGNSVIDLGVPNSCVISGEMYIGDIIDDHNISIEFNGKVLLTDVNIIDTNSYYEIKELSIDGNIIMMQQDEYQKYYDLSSYEGIHDYQIKTIQSTSINTKDEYYGFELKNNYCKNVETKISDKYMVNLNQSTDGIMLSIFKDGTPYQYRYNKGEMILRWMVMILYLEIILTYPFIAITNFVIIFKNMKKEEHVKNKIAS